MQDTFTAAVEAYGQQAFGEAIEGLQAVLAHSPQDQVAAKLLARARQHQAQRVPDNWVG